MTAQSARPFTRKFTRKLITACLAACLLPIALPMLPAIAAPGYKPPSRKSAQRTEGTGRRSGNAKLCAQDLVVPLTLVMPEATADSQPETTLAEPPLYVYLAKPKTLKISLVELPPVGSQIKGDTPVWKQTQAVQAGIVQIPYLVNQKPLEIGKTYTWKVEVDCGPQPGLLPDEKRYTSLTTATISRVEAPEALQSQLKRATSARQRAAIYAAAGLWTETLSAIAEATGNDPAAEQDLQALLNQVGLKAIADREQASTSPATQPVAAPSPTPTPKVPAPAKPADPKKPCH
jgi:Domain of Unknown Function (DUF928)